MPQDPFHNDRLPDHGHQPQPAATADSARLRRA
jgi:hypothetical protein